MSGLAVYLVLWRSLWAVLSQTYYVPDETWQSVEVAHRSVWGTGHLTWEWDEKIRSTLIPSLYSMIFMVLRCLRLDWQWLVILAPKLMTGVLTSLSDLALYHSVRRRDGTNTAAWLLLLTQTNWFLLYSGSRTLATTLETSLFLAALSKYPAPRFMGLASLSVMMRPTAALLWLPLVPHYCTKMLPTFSLKKLAWVPLLPVAVILSVIGLDSFYYGSFTVTPVNFFKANVVQDLSTFYGSNHCMWYFTNCLLPILGPLLVPALLGLSRLSSTISLPILSSFLFFSILPHKEMRFLHPILPLLLYSTARYITKRTSRPPSSRAILLNLLINLPLAFYLSVVHQRGVVDAAIYLGDQPGSTLVLMPCHSTPLYSHIHPSTASIRFLTCLPHVPSRPAIQEEAEQFFSSPESWLEAEYQIPANLPDKILLFSSLELPKFFKSRGFTLCRDWFHSHFPEGRVGGRVELYCRGKG